MGNGQVLAQALLSRQPVPLSSTGSCNEGASGLSPLTQWCLWGNLDTIICLGDWIWLLSDLALTVVGIHLDPALGMLLGATVF